MLYFSSQHGNLGLKLPIFHDLIKNCDVNILSIAYPGFSDSDGKATITNMEKAYQSTILSLFFLMPDYPEINKRINKRYVYLYGDNIGVSVALGLE